VEPGTHDPPQVPGGVFTVPRQALVHVLPGTHVPVALPVVPQVSSCVSLAHAVVPGTQTPPQAPGAVLRVPRHAFVQGVVAGTHTPLALHVSVVVLL